MSSTYSPLLRFELIGSGEQAGLWGTTTNQNLGSLVEQAVAGVATIVLSTTAPYVLQELNGTPDEARCAVLSFIGAPGGATEITIPAKQKLYVVRNSCGSSLTVKCVGDLGTGVEVGDGEATLVFCNGERALAGLQTTATANMTGPGSSTANAIVRWSGTAGTNTLNSAATINDDGAGTFVGNVTIGAFSSTVGGSVSLKESSGQGSNSLSLRAPASLASDITLTLPDSTGSANQVLTTNGSGTLSWVTPSSGAGTVTSVGGTGSVNGITLSGTVTSSGNLTLGGALTGVSLSSQVTGTLPVSNGGTGSSSLSGAGIVTTTGTQTISGTKTFSGTVNFTTLTNFTTVGAGASFGKATANGNYAIWAQPASTSDGYAGLVTLNNATNTGMVSSTTSTGTALHELYYGDYGSAVNVGAITTNGSTTAYNTTSDYRLKENVSSLVNAVTRLKQLAPKNFTWKNNPSLGVVEGFIAHELQAVVPDAVTGTKDAVDEQGNPKYQGIDTSMLVPLLTAALQEALARIEALEAKVG